MEQRLSPAARRARVPAFRRRRRAQGPGGPLRQPVQRPRRRLGRVLRPGPGRRPAGRRPGGLPACGAMTPPAPRARQVARGRGRLATRLVREHGGHGGHGGFDGLDGPEGRLGVDAEPECDRPPPAHHTAAVRTRERSLSGNWFIKPLPG
ncbi:hypothetical protein CA984_39845 [Streptosporangium minutum]|uniref:Uncharacterized protein n=1 Tax=Streptosporangium minutum TaxID=569862 RepID=A0A243QT60_9ACTN|nr:hypothetical protein CA984_39845 [Streptosporangium minutum]